MVGLLTILIIIAFTGCFILHEKYRIKDPMVYTKQWHFYKGGVQFCFFLVVAIISWRIAIVGVVMYWILHDMFLNILALNRGLFYVGYTSSIDRFYRKFKRPELAMAISKSVLLFFTVLGILLIK